MQENEMWHRERKDTCRPTSTRKPGNSKLFAAAVEIRSVDLQLRSGQVAIISVFLFVVYIL